MFLCQIHTTLWSTVVCWYSFDLNILHSGLLPRIIHSAHISWDREKWMKLNSWAEFTSHFPCFSIGLTLMSSGKYTSFILIRVTPSIAVPSAQRDVIFLSQIKDQISLFKLVAGHVMMTFPRKDSLWHEYTTKCNAEFLCPLQCVLTSAWHC